MPSDHIRRHRRQHLTAEEVAEIVALKQRREHMRLHRFKRTTFYRCANIFNVLSFFLHFEILICFIGPCIYARHVARQVQPNFSGKINEMGEQAISSMEVYSETGRRYVFVVNDFVDIPRAKTEFFVGEDYLLRKELKGTFDDDETTYRIFRASPILFLSILALAASVLGYANNLNEHAYSLTAIAVVNGLTVLAILCL